MLLLQVPQHSSNSYRALPSRMGSSGGMLLIQTTSRRQQIRRRTRSSRRLSNNRSRTSRSGIHRRWALATLRIYSRWGYLLTTTYYSCSMLSKAFATERAQRERTTRNSFRAWRSITTALAATIREYLLITQMWEGPISLLLLIAVCQIIHIRHQRLMQILLWWNRLLKGHLLMNHRI